MRHISLYIEQFGKGRVPNGWYRRLTVNIQRLYYIKSGTGYMIGRYGERTPFVPGMIYIFPNNFRQDFVSDEQDSIDHIYMDFSSTPPIVSPQPLVYDVATMPAVGQLLALLDELLVERNMEAIPPIEPPAFFGLHDETEDGSPDEFNKVLYKQAMCLLFLLNREQEIPFSEDQGVTNALEFIRKHYTDRIDIGMIAAKSGYSPDHFIRRFKSVMGVTPYAYLRNYRLYRAEDMIAHGMSVTDTAKAIGYESVVCLSRAMHLQRDRESRSGKQK